MKILLMCVVSLVAMLAGNVEAAEQCTEREAFAAEAVTDYLNNWENVHLFFQQFHHCYEASIAEGAEDKIQILWASHWSELPRMLALTTKDKEFKAFLWQRINDETFPEDRFAQVVRNAKVKCPSKAKEFCRAVIQSASLRHRPNPSFNGTPGGAR